MAQQPISGTSAQSIGTTTSNGSQYPQNYSSTSFSQSDQQMMVVAGGNGSSTMIPSQGSMQASSSYGSIPGSTSQAQIPNSGTMYQTQPGQQYQQNPASAPMYSAQPSTTAQAQGNFNTSNSMMMGQQMAIQGGAQGVVVQQNPQSGPSGSFSAAPGAQSMFLQQPQQMMQQQQMIQQQPQQVTQQQYPQQMMQQQQPQQVVLQQQQPQGVVLQQQPQGVVLQQQQPLAPQVVVQQPGLVQTTTTTTAVTGGGLVTTFAHPTTWALTKVPHKEREVEVVAEGGQRWFLATLNGTFRLSWHLVDSFTSTDHLKCTLTQVGKIKMGGVKLASLKLKKSSMSKFGITVDFANGSTPILGSGQSKGFSLTRGGAVIASLAHTRSGSALAPKVRQDVVIQPGEDIRIIIAIVLYLRNVLEMA